MCLLNNTHDRELQKISTVLLSIDILRRINKIKKKRERETKVIHNISREKRCNRKTLCSRHWTRAACYRDFMLQGLLQRKNTIFKRLLLRQSWAVPDLL